MVTVPTAHPAGLKRGYHSAVLPLPWASGPSPLMALPCPPLPTPHRTMILLLLPLLLASLFPSSSSNKGK